MQNNRPVKKKKILKTKENAQNSQNKLEIKAFGFFKAIPAKPDTDQKLKNAWVQGNKLNPLARFVICF